jgi:hypothetical protein
MISMTTAATFLIAVSVLSTFYTIKKRGADRGMLPANIACILMGTALTRWLSFELVLARIGMGLALVSLALVLRDSLSPRTRTPETRHLAAQSRFLTTTSACVQAELQKQSDREPSRADRPKPSRFRGNRCCRRESQRCAYVALGTRRPHLAPRGIRREVHNPPESHSGLRTCRCLLSHLFLLARSTVVAVVGAVWHAWTSHLFRDPI